MDLRPTMNGRVIGLGLGKFRFVGSGAALLLAALCPSLALAGPEGANVAAGNATIRQNGNRTIIRAGDRTIIDYTRFNVGANETVRFVQPSANARVLNRIKGDAPTTIDGTIKSNGIVYFANRAGVIFGPTATLNVGGIYAAAGNISNNDFLSGINRFTEVTGDVTNAGQIDAKFAAFVGQRVANTGGITAKDGVVAMVSGNEVTLSERGGVMSVRVDPANVGQGSGDQAGVTNTGTINAERGRALMVAGDMYSLAVKNTGNVRAKDIKIEGKGNTRVEVSGTLDASNQRLERGKRGGTIEVTASDVRLSNATLDASGKHGGGTIRVGGDYQGKGELRNATNTTIDAGTTLNADATGKGKGGTVVVWSDNTTRFYGNASASGGVNGGDGGLIETSGKINLDIRGASVSARARGDGRAGLWLMDPVNVNIEDPTGGDDTTGGSFAGGTFDPDNSVSPAIVDANTIKAALEGGTSVTILTGTVGMDAGDINVNTSLSFNLASNVTLTLQAANDINVNQSISASGVGRLNLNLFANSSAAGNNDLNTASGNVNIGAAITTNGGAFATGGVNYTQSAGGTVATNGGNVDIENTGLVTVNDTLNANSASAAAILVRGSSVAFNATVTTGSNGIILVPLNNTATIRVNNGAGDYNISSTTLSNIVAPSGSDIVIGASGFGGDILIGSSGAIDLSSLDLDLSFAGANITFNNSVTVGNARLVLLRGTSVIDSHSGVDVTGNAISFQINGGNLSLDTSVSSILNNSSVTGNLTIDNSSGLTFVNLTVGGNLDMRASGAIFSAGDVQVTGTSAFVTRQNGGASIDLQGTNNLFGGAVTARSRNAADSANAAGPISIASNGALSFGQVATTGSLTAAAAGNISSTGTVATGNASFASTVSGGTITLNQLQSSGTVNFNTTGSGANVTLVNDQALAIGSSSSVGGNLDLTASGALTSSGPLNVSGTSVFETRQNGGAAITLNNVGNQFGGTVTARSRNAANSANAAGPITIVSNGALSFAQVATTGTLTATAAGNISSTGAVATGDASFESTLTGGTITINQLQSSGTVEVVTIGSGANVTLVNNQALTVGGMSAVGGNLTLTTTSGNLNVGAMTVSGSTATFTTQGTNDDISVSTITGATNFSVQTTGATGNASVAGAGIMDITSNVGGTLSFTAGDFVNVTSTPTLNLAASSAMGNVNIIAPDVNITGTLNADGTITLQPNDNADTVSIGDAPADFNLSQAELQNLNSVAGLVIIGRSAGTGAIAIGGTGDVTAGTNYDLTIRGGALTFNGGLTIDGDRLLTLNTLGISSPNMGTDVTVPGSNGRLVINTNGAATLTSNVAKFAATVGGGALDISNVGPLEITSIDMVDGVTSTDAQNINMTSTGTITLTESVTTTNAGDISITSSSGPIFFGSGAQVATGTTGGVSLSADGDIRGVAGSNTQITAGNINLTSNTGQVGSVSALRTETSVLIASGTGGIDVVNTGDLDAQLNSSAGDVTLFNTGNLSTLVSAWTGRNLTVNATGEITFARDISATAGNAILTSGGLMTIANGRAISSTGGNIVLKATDLVLNGTLNAGANQVYIVRASAGTIGVGNATGDMTISNAELANITASLLGIGDVVTTLITVDGVAAMDVANIAQIGFNAAAGGGDVTFSGGASTFRSMFAQASDSINVNADVSATDGTLTFVADQDMITDAGGDTINIANNITISTTSPSGGAITLTATGGIVGAGSLLIDSNAGLLINNAISSMGTLNLRADGGITLNGGSGSAVSITANDGVTISDDLTNTSGTTVINADADANGSGVFSLASGKTITTSGNNLNISASDVVIDGTINVGVATLAIAPTTSSTIGLGAGAGGIQISGDELGRITAGTLALGNALTTNITIDSVSSTDTANISSLFSFLTDDINIAGQFNTGNASFALARGAAGNIFVGLASGSGLVLSNAELANITTNNLQIGGAATNRITLNGVNEASTMGIAGGTTLISNQTITFSSNASTFNSLTARAVDGIVVNASVTTTSGDLRLDGDSNDAADANDGITIASGRFLDSAGDLVLESTTGGISGSGSMTLRADGTIDLRHDLTSSGLTTITADQDNSGAGTLLVASGRTVSTSGSDLVVSAADLVLDGAINTGAGSASITRSSSGTIGLGTATGDMTVSGSELGRIIATGLTIGGSTVSGMTVSGVSATNSNGIAGLLRLEAGSGQITFAGGDSTFNQLDARASSGIVVNSNLLTDLGSLRLDGNSDSSGSDAVTLGANLTANIPPASGSNPTVAFNINLASDVILSQNVTIVGKDVSFRGKVDSSTGNARALTVNTFGGGATTFGGDVGTTGRLFTITTNNDGFTRLSGVMRTNGTVTFNDAVRIVEDTTIDVSGGAGILFNSFVNTALDAPSARSLTLLTARSTNEGAINFPLISFANRIGNARALNNLFLNYDGTMGGDGRANVPGIATIIARPRDSSGNIIASPTTPFNFDINLTGIFRMGKNEKFTSGGTLDITAPGGAFLGDLVSLRNMRVASPDIRLIRRAGGRLLGDLGAFGTDSGLDFVSGGTINFTSVPTVIGTGLNPSFGTPDGGGDVSDTLSTFLFQAFGDITNASINSSGTPLRTLDLKPSGPTNTNIANTIAGAIPRESRTNDVAQDTTISQAQFAQIQQLGIFPRNATAGELLDLLAGSATYDDFPRRSPPSAEDYTTVVNRLPANRVTELMQSYDALFNKPMLDDAGQPVLDENGKPRRVSRTKEIQDTLLASVRRFAESTGAKGDIDPAAFRAFLESNEKEADALNYVRQIGAFLTQLERIGLTARELAQSKQIILNPVRPRGFRTNDAFEAVVKADATRAAR